MVLECQPTEPVVGLNLLLRALGAFRIFQSDTWSQSWKIKPQKKSWQTRAYFTQERKGLKIPATVASDMSRKSEQNQGVEFKHSFCNWPRGLSSIAEKMEDHCWEGPFFSIVYMQKSPVRSSRRSFWGEGKGCGKSFDCIETCLTNSFSHPGLLECCPVSSEDNLLFQGFLSFNVEQLLSLPNTKVF